MNNQIKNIVILGVFFLTGFTSCSEKELTHKEKIKEVVEVYVADMLKTEPILEYSIDSIEINNITEKSKLLVESLADKKEALNKMGEAKELGKQYQSTKVLVDIIQEGEGESNTAKMGLNSMNEYKEKADILIKDAKQLIKDAEDKIEKWETADSTSIAYYEVIARGTMTSIKNVQKNALFPFHISKDYKILKEPLDLLQMPK